MWNQTNLNANSKRKKNGFKKNFKNAFQFNPPENYPSSLPPNDINNSIFSSFTPPIQSKALFNEPVFKEVDHTRKKSQGMFDVIALIKFITWNNNNTSV